MSEKTSENSENRGGVMSALDEASGIVRFLSEPCPPGDKVSTAIRRSARRLRGWSVSRVKDIWYADGRVRVSGDELNELRRLRRQEQEAKARDEYSALTEFLAPILRRLDAIAADVARAPSRRPVDDIGEAGAADRALDRE